MLIAYAPGADEARREHDEERFSRFARALESAGLGASVAPFSRVDELAAAARDAKADLVYSAAHAALAADGSRVGVHGFLESLGLPFVGSPEAAVRLALDKAALKSAWHGAGVATPAWLVSGDDDELIMDDLPPAAFPFIVKPALEGNSRGISRESVVRDAASLRARVDVVKREFGKTLVERFLEGPDRREFTVAMLGNGPHALVLPAELRFRETVDPPLITTGDKDGHRTRALPVGDVELSAGLVAFARRAFAAAGVRDYARGDFILSNGRLYAIEVNGQPMVPDAWFEACARGFGLDERGYLVAIVLAALARLAASGRRLSVDAAALRLALGDEAFERMVG